MQEADEALTSCATCVPSYDILLLGLLLVHYDKKPLLAGELPLLVGLVEDVDRGVRFSFGGRLGAFFKAGVEDRLLISGLGRSGRLIAGIAAVASASDSRLEGAVCDGCKV